MRYTFIATETAPPKPRTVSKRSAFMDENNGCLDTGEGSRAAVGQFGDGARHEGRDFAGSQAGWTGRRGLGREQPGLCATWEATGHEARAAQCCVCVKPILVDLVACSGLRPEPFSISRNRVIPTILNTVGPRYCSPNCSHGGNTP